MGIIGDLRKENSPQDIEILGETLVVYPGVFSPKYFTDAVFFAEVVPKIVNMGSFCEVGVGSGVVSLFVALNGSKKLAGTDVNSNAIKNTKDNFNRHNLSIDLYKGDVLDSVPQGNEFDYIFWNHPFNNVEFEVKDDLLKSVLDQNFVGLQKYFATASSYLKKGGTLILGTGELADQAEVLKLASKHNWKLQKTHDRNSKVRVGGERPMKLYIYEFTR